MKIIRISPIIFALISIILLTNCSKNKWEFESPNQQIRLHIENRERDGKNMLYYSIEAKSQNSEFVKLVEPSALGLKTSIGDFFENLKIKSFETKGVISEEYTMTTGGTASYENKYNSVALTITDTPLKIIFRLYNNGVAFQYNVDNSRPDSLKILSEYTNLNLGDAIFWAHPYDTITQWTPGYETYYSGPMEIGTEVPEGKNGWAFPLLFEKNKTWLFISESGFDGSYGASHLNKEVKDGIFKIKFAEDEEANNLYSSYSISTMPWASPWRFITIGRSLGEIVESHQTTDLAFPSKITDTDWIIPGASSWSWWSDNESPKDYNRLIPFVDLASEMEWKYSLIDANWNQMKNGSLKQLVEYAAQKNVGLLIWYNSGGPHNFIPEEPRDLMDKRTVRRIEFKRISQMGIKGIKIDFFQSDKQAIIKQYIEILEDAAEYKIMVNFHGCTLPKGWRRTYPNLLTMEAIRGAETYLFGKDYPMKAPGHITTIPFLRGVSGPTDYTPVGLSNRKYPRLTSDAFELALPIIIESGITHYTEKPDIIRNLPDFAIKYLKTCPTTWDETKYLAGYPGKDAVIARRKGKQWYIAAINGENKAKTIHIDLTELKIEKASAMTILDKSENEELHYESFILEKQKTEIHLKPFGGHILILDNIRPQIFE